MTVPDLNPFDRQELEILLYLVRELPLRLEHTQMPESARERLGSIENKLAAQLIVADFSGAIAEDVRRKRTSRDIREEIIMKVGMMADARTPEMQARYDAAVARECGLANH